jgi:hypothetical protein
LHTLVHHHLHPGILLHHLQLSIHHFKLIRVVLRSGLRVLLVVLRHYRLFLMLGGLRMSFRGVIMGFYLSCCRYIIFLFTLHFLLILGIFNTLIILLRSDIGLVEHIVLRLRLSDLIIDDLDFLFYSGEAFLPLRLNLMIGFECALVVLSVTCRE